MPYRLTWMKPELFHAAKGVRVYHTYHDDDFTRGPTSHWFTLHPQCELESCRCEKENCPHIFDVRELSTWRQPSPTNRTTSHHRTVNPSARRRNRQRERRAIRTAIVKAIESGELTRDGRQPPRSKPHRRRS